MERQMQRKTTIQSVMALLVLVVVMIAPPTVQAASDAGVSGAFLRFGSSARSLALGGAVSGLGGDASTAYWNPAGLSQLRTMEITAMGATLFADTKYNYISFGMPSSNNGVFAFSGTFVNSGEFQRASLFEDLNDTFSEKEGVFTLSYARGSSRLGWGVNFKSISQDIDGRSGTAIGADLGLYMRPDRRLSLGFSWQNALQPEITLDEEPEKLARTVRGGAVFRFWDNRFLVTTDLVKTEFMDLDFQSGMELWPVEQIVLRGGYDTVREQASFGAGVRYQNWQLDYAYVSHDLGATTVVSATMRFGVSDGIRISSDRARFSPTGNDRSVSFDIETAVRGEVDEWMLEVLDERGELVRRISEVGPPPATVKWSGDDENGRLVGDGRYQARMTIIDDLGQPWTHVVDVEILGFRNRTRTPIRIDISGSQN